MVRAEHPAAEPKDAKVLWSEMGNGKLCRRIPLPTAIDPDKTSASLEHGVLSLTAVKAAAVQPKPIPIAA